MRASIAVHIDAIAALSASAEASDPTKCEAMLRGLFSLSGRVT